MRTYKKKKYIFTGETMVFEGHVLKRIKFLQNVGGYANMYELGGWIESEHNLSHDGRCAVLHEAKVFGNAQVKDASLVANNAVVKDNVSIENECHVGDNSIIGADTKISGDTLIHGTSKVFFYEQSEEKKIKPSNVSGYSTIKSCIIEATGTINNSIIIKQELSGSLDIVDKRIQ